jgi:serine/threonine protein kinase
MGIGRHGSSRMLDPVLVPLLLLVKVLDFGLAKALDPQGSAANIQNSPTLSFAGTQTDAILGTAACMSPEQARGKPVDKRADIWAFEATLRTVRLDRFDWSGGQAMSLHFRPQGPAS